MSLRKKTKAGVLLSTPVSAFNDSPFVQSLRRENSSHDIGVSTPNYSSFCDRDTIIKTARDRLARRRRAGYNPENPLLAFLQEIIDYATELKQTTTKQACIDVVDEVIKEATDRMEKL